MRGGNLERQEIILLGEYKQFRSDRHYYVDNAGEQDIAAVLVQLSDFIESYSYAFSGIDISKVDSLVNVGPGMPAVCEFLKSFKRDSLLPAAQNKPTMMPIGESYLVNQLLKRAGVAFKPNAITFIQSESENPEDHPNPSSKVPQIPSEFKDQIVFIGNCKGWFAAKKMTLNEKTQDWEVSGILSGINHTLVNKAFGFAQLSGEAPAGRKSLGNLVQALSQVDATNPYIVCKTCENFGYPPYATPTMLTEAYPDIKPPKVKGRKPKA